MNTSTFRHSRILVAACSVATLLALGACGRQEDNRTVGQQVDAAVSKTEQVAQDAKEKAQSSMASAGDAMKDAGRDAKASASNAATAIGEKLDDASITASVSAGLAKDPELSALKIDVDTKDGIVSLQGPAPSANARERATEIAKGVKGVSSVNNQLMVKAG